MTKSISKFRQIWDEFPISCFHRGQLEDYIDFVSRAYKFSVEQNKLRFDRKQQTELNELASQNKLASEEFFQTMPVFPPEDWVPQGMLPSDSDQEWYEHDRMREWHNIFDDLHYQACTDARHAEWAAGEDQSREKDDFETALAGIGALYLNSAVIPIWASFEIKVSSYAQILKDKKNLKTALKNINYGNFARRAHLYFLEVCGCELSWNVDALRDLSAVRNCVAHGLGKFDDNNKHFRRAIEANSNIDLLKLGDEKQLVVTEGYLRDSLSLINNTLIELDAAACKVATGMNRAEFGKRLKDSVVP